MNNLLASIPFMIFGVLVLIYIVGVWAGGIRERAGSSKSLSGSLSKVLMGSGSGKKSSKRSSGGNKKYMGFTMTQILVGAAVIIGIYYYKEGFTDEIDGHFKKACGMINDDNNNTDTKKNENILPLIDDGELLKPELPNKK